MKKWECVVVLMGEAVVCMLVAVCVCCFWGVVWCGDPDRAVWEHQGMEGGWEEGVQHVKPGNRCLFTTGETVPTQNNERALPLLNKKENKKSISAFLSPLKVMELEIGSPHKSLQSVGSLVWPSTVPRLRSLSTEQSQAKHIFIDCACVYVCLKRGGEHVCMFLFGRAECVRVSFSAYAQNKGALRSIQHSRQMCDTPPFSHHKLV